MGADNMDTYYKIRRKDTDQFSHGTISKYYSKEKGRLVIQKWSSIGKLWKNRNLLEKHLLACRVYGPIDKDWEVVEYKVQPVEPMNYWLSEEKVEAMLKKMTWNVLKS
jgi:hypothetical protein